MLTTQLEGTRHRALPVRRTVGILCGLLVVPAFARAQDNLYSVDFHIGVVAATALIESTVALIPAEGLDAVIGDLSLAQGISPLAAVAVRRILSPRLVGELRGTVAVGPVNGSGPNVDWEAGDLTAITASAGVTVLLGSGLEGRLGVGKIFYSASDVVLFEEDADTGILGLAGLSFELPGPRPFMLGAEVQTHDFGTPGMRRVGGVDGRVTRLVVSVGYRFELGGGS